jgi:hypothetical protein
MDELGLPEAVDIYVDRREQRIGIVTGTSHKTYRADSSSTSSRRAVSLAGTLSDMRIPTEAVAKRPKFEVVMMDGRPMLVIWPLAPAEET